jgi:hypothetical protein
MSSIAGQYFWHAGPSTTQATDLKAQTYTSSTKQNTYINTATLKHSTLLPKLKSIHTPAEICTI